MIDPTNLDIGLMIGYFLFVFGFGAYFGKYIKSTSDFFFSGRKFAWWIIAFSMIATVVGSYSFIKYSAAGFRYGLSSSMSYLNDWFFMPLWMFMWLPIIYFCRLKSIPEYFERRFGPTARFLAILFITVYLVGYIGINFYTLGVALKHILGWSVFTTAVVVAIVTAIYVTSGGQTAVIMTDLLQGVLLLVAGLFIFFLGFSYLGDGNLIDGIDRFWNGLPQDHRYAIAHFNEPHKFHFIGVFWQDALASSFAAYFFNQGILMRFLALRSVHEGRKAMAVALVILFPIAVIAVGNAGWLGASMYNLGMIPAGYPETPDPNDIFVIVTHILAEPGIFGLVMAALLAALMSTADTLINATSAVAINDIYQPYIKPGKSDKHYLRAAQIASILAAFLGLCLVPLFMEFDSIYVAHATFIAAVTPPMAVCILYGFLWKRFTSKAAIATLVGGAIAMGVSIAWPSIIKPVAHGVDAAGDYKYMRALYGLLVSGVIGFVATLLTTHSKSEEEMVGLTVGTLKEAERRFKGGEINRQVGVKVRMKLVVGDEESASYRQDPDGDVLQVSLHKQDLERMKARVGDMIFIADERWWLGGLRAAHALVLDDQGVEGQVTMPDSYLERNSMDRDRDVVVEMIM